METANCGRFNHMKRERRIRKEIRGSYKAEGDQQSIDVKRRLDRRGQYRAWQDVAITVNMQTIKQ